MGKARLTGIAISAVLLLTSIDVNGQCRYCNTYKDFLEDRWQPLDTVYCKSHSKSHQLWWGGNDYTLTTGDKNTDNLLKKDAFVVMQGDSIYINCRNLRYEKTHFGNGYTKARRIGKRSLLFVNRLIGTEVMNEQVSMGVMFGAIGGMITVSKQNKQQVCYVISKGGDSKGLINIRLIDDDLMKQMIDQHHDLYKEYFEEEDEMKRMLAEHIIPILEKSGLFEQAKPKTE